MPILPPASLALLPLSASGGNDAPLFAEVHRALASRSTELVLCTDVDGDGDADLVSGRARLQVERNDGYGVFQPAGPGLGSAVVYFDAAAGDLNGDGDVDLAAGSLRNVELWSGDGAGGFVDASAGLPPTPVDPDHVGLSDVDGDGDLDLFLGVRSASSGFPPNDQLFLNDGTGTFVDAAAGLPSTGTYGFAFGDVDADGDPDLVLGGFQIERLLLNDGAGGFTEAVGQLPALPGQNVTPLLGDLDGDGDPDLVMVQRSGAFEEVLLNDGGGTFSIGPGIPDAGQHDNGGVLFDADGDLDLDLYVTADITCVGLPSCELSQDRLLLNDGSGLFSPSAFVPVDEPSDDVLAADLDGDGDLDLVVASDERRLYLADGAGDFTLGSVDPSLGDLGTAGFAIADFDGDGIQDALAFATDAPPALLSGVSGLGLVPSANPLPASLPGVLGSAAAGDLDGDGDVDLFVGAPLARNRVLANGGQGSFEDDTLAVPPSETDTRQAVLADVDGDGDLDAVEGNRFVRDRVLRNDGTHRFSTAPLPPLAFDGDSALAAADFDLDGDVDFIGAGQEGDSLMLNTGTGTFTAANANLPAWSGTATDLAVGDVDADGDPDVLELGKSFQVPRLLTNDGAASFAQATLPALPTGDLRAVALLDADGDGDLDALLGYVGATDTLLENQGGGVFAARPELLAAEGDDVRSFTFGDLDDDGDPDVLVGNYRASERLWTNLTRQVARRNVLGIGKRLSLELRGPASGTVYMGLAQGTAAFPSGFGTLRLDPLTLEVAGTFALDAEGTADALFPVPAEPSLVGATFWMQGLVGPPFRLSNVERLPITGF